jgi:hypothetical protein
MEKKRVPKKCMCVFVGKEGGGLSVGGSICELNRICKSVFCWLRRQQRGQSARG